MSSQRHQGAPETSAQPVNHWGQIIHCDQNIGGCAMSEVTMQMPATFGLFLLHGHFVFKIIHLHNMG